MLLQRISCLISFTSSTCSQIPTGYTLTIKRMKLAHLFLDFATHLILTFHFSGMLSDILLCFGTSNGITIVVRVVGRKKNCTNIINSREDGLFFFSSYCCGHSRCCSNCSIAASFITAIQKDLKMLIRKWKKLWRFST